MTDTMTMNPTTIEMQSSTSDNKLKKAFDSGFVPLIDIPVLGIDVALVDMADIYNLIFEPARPSKYGITKVRLQEEGEKRKGCEWRLQKNKEENYMRKGF